MFVGSTTARMMSNLYMANWSENAFNKTKEESLHSLIVFGVYGISAGGLFVEQLVNIKFSRYLLCYLAILDWHRMLPRQYCIPQTTDQFYSSCPNVILRQDAARAYHEPILDGHGNFGHVNLPKLLLFVHRIGGSYSTIYDHIRGNACYDSSCISSYDWLRVCQRKLL